MESSGFTGMNTLELDELEGTDWICILWQSPASKCG